MKIAQIVCTYPPYKGGIGNSARHFAQVLAKRGIQTTVFTPKYTKEEYNSEANQINKKIQVARILPWIKYGNSAIIPGIYSRMKKFDRILLHYPFFGGSEIVWLFKILARNKTPLIIHYHMDIQGLNFLPRLLSIPSNLIFNSLFKRADHITCASLDYIKYTKLKKIYQKYPKKFTEIPFGVDTNKFHPSPPKTHNKKRLLFVGGLDKAHYFKGLPVLLKTAAILKDTPGLPEWKFTIVGEGKLKKTYKKQVGQLGIKEKVAFKGELMDSELISIYQKNDLLILPSINKGEAFGLVLLEAIACGTPVIASDLPGVRGIFKNNKQGLTAEAGNEKDLADKIKILLLDESKREEMGRQAIKLIQQKYSWEKVGDELEKIIKSKF